MFEMFSQVNDERGEKEEEAAETSRFAWIRPSNCNPRNLSPKELSFKIENIAKIVFPTLFAVFVIFYFIIFAGIMPHNKDNWIIQPSTNTQGAMTVP
ncbi:glutamate-gated chloride channel [Trichonephila clavipes]|nr:glutamate-gated chloride channel [Trichonephila clavipes]